MLDFRDLFFVFRCLLMIFQIRLRVYFYEHRGTRIQEHHITLASIPRRQMSFRMGTSSSNVPFFTEHFPL